MSNFGTVDQVRNALAAFETGNSSLQALEAVVSDAMRTGLWTPNRAMDFLRDAVERGVVPIESVVRLGLSPGTETVLRSSDDSSSSGSAGGEESEPDPLSEGTSHARIGSGHLLAGRYRLQRKLGEGGMGVVYLANDEHVKSEQFAVKVLQHNFRTIPDFLELLREEVRKTRTLAHPNIVGVYSLNVDGDDVFVLMELLEGKTLQDLLDQDFGRGMRFDRAWSLIEGISAGLAYAHDHSIIHGDLKPANVFVTTAGRAKLLDFGIARAARGPARKLDATALGALTPAYASCEMLEFLTPDMRDDIYSFSCIIYEALSGRHPFGGRRAVEARDANEKPARIDTLTDRQNGALARGLAFERTARTPTVESLLAGLAPIDYSKTKSAFSKVPLFSAGAVIVAFALVLIGQTWFAKHFTSENAGKANLEPLNDKSIAVLPFSDMSEKRDQEYFADGMAEEILDLLAKVPTLTVIGRTSSFAFKGKNEDLRTIGAQLNVAHILEGSVRSSGDRIRVNTKLVNAHTGAQEWSETYDRTMGDVLKLQDTVANAVTRELQLTVVPDNPESHSTVKDFAAYDLLLRGRHALDRFDASGLNEAASLFQQALDREPAFSEAAAQLAWTYDAQGEWEYVVPTQAFERARATARKALELDPKNVLAHYVLGRIHVVYDWDWSGAANEFSQVTASVAGKGNARDSEALLSIALAHWDVGVSQLTAALSQDPLDTPSLYLLASLQWRLGHFSDAEASVRRALEIRPSFGLAHLMWGFCLLYQGEQAGALTQIQLETSDAQRQEGLATVYYAMGRRADADLALRVLVNKYADTDAVGIAEVYAYRNDADQAMHWLDRAYDQKDPTLYSLRADLRTQSLESDVRYKAFLRKMNQ